MSAVALIGSVGAQISPCPCHPKPQDFTGIVITGSSDHTIESSGVARLGDIVLCSCGHSAPLISTTKIDNTTNGIPKCEIGSIFSACPLGIIITGSATVT